MLFFKLARNICPELFCHTVLKYLQKSWEDFCESLYAENHNKDLWSALKNKRNPFNNIEPLNTPAGIAYSNEQKTETIASSLEDQFVPHNIPDDKKFTESINATKSKMAIHYQISLLQATPTEVLNYIKKTSQKRLPAMIEYQTKC